MPYSILLMCVCILIFIIGLVNIFINAPSRQLETCYIIYILCMSERVCVVVYVYIGECVRYLIVFDFAPPLISQPCSNTFTCGMTSIRFCVVFKLMLESKFHFDYQQFWNEATATDDGGAVCVLFVSWCNSSKRARESQWMRRRHMIFNK